MDHRPRLRAPGPHGQQGRPDLFLVGAVLDLQDGRGCPPGHDVVGVCPYTGKACGCLRGSIMNRECVWRSSTEEFQRVMARQAKGRVR